MSIFFIFSTGVNDNMYLLYFTDTWNWITTKGSGDLIPPMTGCASVRVGDFHVLYHGGWDTLANEKVTFYCYFF